MCEPEFPNIPWKSPHAEDNAIFTIGSMRRCPNCGCLDSSHYPNCKLGKLTKE
jgi:hypothetical protein